MPNRAGGTDAVQGRPSDPALTGSPSLRGLLDVLVYAPIGFALSAGTLVPELAAKGRARAAEQVRLARMIGQFAVPVVKRKGEELVRDGVAKAVRSARPTPAKLPSTSKPAFTSKPVFTSKPAFTSKPVFTSEPPARPKPSPRLDAAHSRAAPLVTALPIDRYDELPAASIMALLEGLRPGQLRAIDAHERANRGRRTVLTRIAQLLT